MKKQKRDCLVEHSLMVLAFLIAVWGVSFCTTPMKEEKYVYNLLGKKSQLAYFDLGQDGEKIGRKRISERNSIEIEAIEFFVEEILAV